MIDYLGEEVGDKAICRYLSNIAAETPRVISFILLLWVAEIKIFFVVSLYSEVY